MKITISSGCGVSWKRTADYQSEGVTLDSGLVVELEIDSTDPAEIKRMHDHWTAELDRQIDRHLARRRQQYEAAQEPAKEPEPPTRRPEAPARQERPADHIDNNGQRWPQETEAEQDRRQYGRRTNDGKVWTGRTGVPRNGRELLGWSRRTNRQDELEAMGRRMRLPERILDWTEDEVADVHQAMTAADQPRNGHRNGAAY
jgi:hypothetical protein